MAQIYISKPTHHQASRLQTTYVCRKTPFPKLFSPMFTHFSQLVAPEVTCHQASPLQTIYGRWIPKTTAIFTRVSSLVAPQVTCHQASPLQTIYGRWIPKRPARLDNINLPMFFLKKYMCAHIQMKRK
jgi:hypothetical protein